VLARWRHQARVQHDRDDRSHGRWPRVGHFTDLRNPPPRTVFLSSTVPLFICSEIVVLTRSTEEIRCANLHAQTCSWTTLVCRRAQRGVLMVGQRVVKLVCGRTHGRVLLVVRLARSVRVRRRVQRRRVQLVPRLCRRLQPPGVVMHPLLPASRPADAPAHGGASLALATPASAAVPVPTAAAAACTVCAQAHGGGSLAQATPASAAVPPNPDLAWLLV
jgi:hypothetical protein